MLGIRIAMLIIGAQLQDNPPLNTANKEIQKIEEDQSWNNKIYLATYPRSGNHWMRYLIEEATGIATSSIYIDPDPPHLPNLFPWGGYCCHHGYEGNCRYPKKEEPVVVKIHFPAIKPFSFSKLHYSRAVRIIRHPIDSFYSFYTYNKSKHSEFMIPKERITTFIESWRRFQEYWDIADNVLTIRFEDLYKDSSFYLKLVLEYIGYRFTQEDIERAVKKYPASGGILKHIVHFTKEDLLMIQTELGDLLQKYEYEIDGVL